jgi:hypothetical protein
MTFVIKKDNTTSSLYVGIRSVEDAAETQTNDVWIELETQAARGTTDNSPLVFKQDISRTSMKSLDFDSMQTVFQTWNYDAAYLAHFVKKAEANGDVALHMAHRDEGNNSNQKPIEVMYSFGDLCFFSFFLSPHVSESDAEFADTTS